ncbi:MAG: mechanosensitive ion channel family protein [Candidatus Cloacimonadota bacterium]|nr:MAG: mechanosensitive ion channel family protein [Candidatus Cloacimonadota bacterium]
MQMKQWLLTHGLRIIFIIIGYVVLIFVVRLLTRKFVRLVEDEDRSTRSEREKRADSIASIINTTSWIFFGIIVLFMILREFNVNITPLLTGAGVAGLAIAFGAQSVIKDFLYGFFLLAEDQIRVGDVVKLGEHSGVVERITIRTTRLRSLDGNVHIIPNGEIKAVINMTHGWSRALVDVDVAYKEDLDRVMAIIEAVAAGLQKEDKYKKSIIEKPKVLGVEKLGDSGITIRLIVKTTPLKQWEITRELRKRIKTAFDRAGIEIPFPQMVIHGQQLSSEQV